MYKQAELSQLSPEAGPCSCTKVEINWNVKLFFIFIAL